MRPMDKQTSKITVLYSSVTFSLSELQSSHQPHRNKSFTRQGCSRKITIPPSVKLLDLGLGEYWRLLSKEDFILSWRP